MFNRTTFMAVVMATTCLTSLAAYAGEPGNTSYNNGIEIGTMWVGGTNPDQAGRYNGLNTKGFDALVQFNSRQRPVGNSTWYYDFTGDNLVFQTGSHLGSGASNGSSYTSSVNNDLTNNGDVALNFGKQGTWETHVSFRSITYTGNVVDSIYNVNSHGIGSLNSGLTSWGGATAAAAGSVTSSTLNISGLSATGAMQPFQVGTRRNIVTGNFKYIYGHWTFTGAVRHEHKYGTQEESFDGPWGGTVFELPIDYDTDRYDVSARYDTRLNQILLQYTFSQFTDANSFVNLPYPYTNTSTPYQLSAAYSTPPSNSAHYLTLEAASNMIPKTRVNLNARVGLEMQDDGFPPNTADPDPSTLAGFSNVNPYTVQGTTANSLNDIAEVYQGDISASSTPIANTSLRVYYGLDGRNVSLNQYQVTVGTEGGARAETGLTQTEYVVPQDWLIQRAGVNVGYRLIPQYKTRLTLGYEYKQTARSNAQVGNASTNTASLRLTSSIGPNAFGRLSFVHASRTGVLSYILPWANLNGIPATFSCGSSSSACSGAYYQAPMTSNAVQLMVDYTPRPDLTATLFLQYKNEDYTYPPESVTLAGVGHGIKNDYNLIIGPDLTYRPRKNMRVHVYYTFERIFFNNLGNGACATSNTGSCAGSIGYFKDQYTSDVHTIGVSGKWHVTDKLKLGADYTFAYGSVMYGLFNGVFVSNPSQPYQNVSNYPDINSTMHDISLTADYAVRRNMDLLFLADWEYFHNNDWNDTAGPIQGNGGTSISFLTPGYGSPNYSVVAAMAGVRYTF